MRPVVARGIALSLVLAGFLACRQADGPAAAPPDERRAEEADLPAAFQRRTMHFPSGDDDSSPLRLDHDAPREIWVGHPFTEVITVTNQSDDVLHGVVVRGRLPRAYRPAPEDGAARRDGGATWDVGTLRAGESREIRLTGTVLEAGELTTCLEAAFTPQLCTTRRALVPNLELTLRAPAEALICEPLAGELVVRNAGEAPLRDVRVRAELPDGLRTDAGEATAGFDAGDLDPGESETRRIPLKAARPGAFPLKAVARAGPIAREASAAMLVREPVLKIEPRAPAERFAGGEAVLELVVSNISDTPSHDTVVAAALTRGARLRNASDDGRISGSGATWTLGTLAPGASRTLSTSYTAEDPGAVEAVARARGHCARDVEARTVTDFKGAPAVLLEVVDDPDPVVVGGRVTYAIRVTNQGQSPLTNIRLVCGLEAPMAQPAGAGKTAARADATPARTLDFLPLTVLAPKERADWTVTVTAAEPADARFRVTMTCDQIARPVEETESTHFFK